MEDEWQTFLMLLDELADRRLTGQDAVDTIHRFLHAVDPTRGIWYGRVINRDLRVGANVATFGAVWPDLRSKFGVSLADKFDSTVKLNYPVAVETKLDGLRITLVFTDGKGVAKTRSGKEYNEVLEHILSSLGPVVGTGAIDGEIMADWAKSGPQSTYGGKRYKSPWGKTSAMLKTGTYKGVFNPDRVSPEMWDELRRDLKFWVFDQMTLDVYDPAIGMDKTPFIERRDNLFRTVVKTGKVSPIKLMEQHIAHDRTELDEAHADFLAAEHEGSMIKMLDAPYFPDRTSAMLKRKELEFIDGIILEVLPGNGRNARWAGSYRVRLTSGAETSCNIRGDANRQDHWDRRSELIGTHIEMTQQKDAKAVSETARFPVFIRLRDDLPRSQV
jgi:ATP-dependent DNA ligase